MFCVFCRDLKFTNTMALGTNHFKSTTITRHIESSVHRQSIITPNFRNRLLVENIDKVIMVVIEGGDLKEFDFKPAIDIWENLIFPKLMRLF